MSEKLSHHSIAEAEADRASFSTYKGALGAAGAKARMTTLEREPMILPITTAALEVDLSWDHRHHHRGIMGKVLSLFGQGRVDLDLGCLYELQDGKKGCLQAFGNLFGNYDASPFISHSGDERAGTAPGADESISINGAHWSDIKRVLVYAYIYEGVPDWQSLRIECTLRHGDAEAVQMRLSEDRDHLPICALVMLENDGGAVKLTRCAEYFHGHPELDRAYGFGMNWQEGSK